MLTMHGLLLFRESVKRFSSFATCIRLHDYGPSRRVNAGGVLAFKASLQKPVLWCARGASRRVAGDLEQGMGRGETHPYLGEGTQTGGLCHAEWEH